MPTTPPRTHRRLVQDRAERPAAVRASRIQDTKTGNDHDEAYLALVGSLGQVIESCDRYTFGHCERVAAYAMAVAHSLGLSGEELTTVRIGAYLHDLGKVAVPSEILNKQGELTHEEIEIIRTHPVRGVELLAAIEFPWDIRPIIRWHHERYDGSGYPDGLSGDAIPVTAQIVGIADAYDALTTTRSYRQAVPAQDALAEMREDRRLWQPDVYRAFMTVFTVVASRVA
jgi:putative nucleotidyltransferase with HDIG domain